MDNGQWTMEKGEGTREERGVGDGTGERGGMLYVLSDYKIYHYQSFLI